MMNCAIFVVDKGYAKKDSKAVLKSRLAAMNAAEPQRTCGRADAMDTSETLSRKRNRAMDDAKGNSGDLPGAPERPRFCSAKKMELRGNGRWISWMAKCPSADVGVADILDLGRVGLREVGRI